MFSVDVGPQYEGENIRKADFHVEFGGPKCEYKAELVTVLPMDEVEHEKVTIIGPDIKDMEEGSSNSIFIKIDMAGEELEKDMEPVFERRHHVYTNYLEGFWHMAQRDAIWMRIHKDAFANGLNSFEEIGQILIMLYTNELPLIEKMQITYITDPELVKEHVLKARPIYQERDDRLKGMKEEDVEDFYGCILCQSFAPTHVCVITPERMSLCGAISWLDGRAAYKIDPEGGIFVVEKGELLDSEMHVYSGVNEMVAQRSLGRNSIFHLHTALENPHTSCGCFQAICFYIPEVDGFGIVHRDFVGGTVTGDPFSSMAGNASGGVQTEGFLGMAVSYMRSPKFIISDGGWNRVVWLPKAVKEEVKDAIPEDMYGKIATEDDVKDVDELVEFLQKVEHPQMVV
ncbi:MAG: CO dehydrogenase/CO-methylating acetyl-CoA synthase complex subunit beta [Firmicutes bacterium]|nr:CO dehydrogenase/CO-methylating acetyl-CoA synthase complex subunit beta [Bacillota bacterium]